LTAVTNADVTVIDVTGDVDRTRCLVGEVEALLRVDVQLIEFSPKQQSLTDKEVKVTDSGTTFGEVNRRRRVPGTTHRAH
jgi:hypothetical protein